MRRVSVVAVGLLSVLLLAASAGAALSPEQTKRLVVAEQWAAENPQSCALLDDPKASQLMDGLLLKLAVLCGRADLLGRVAQEENEGPAGEALGTDVRANDVTLPLPTGEVGSRTQSETAVARNETTGTLCSGFNDSYSGVVQGLGYTGFSRSTDGGVTWSDRGAVPAAGAGQSFGDPALAWRKSDGNFYIATLHTSGLGLWKSTDDCQTMTWVGVPHAGGNDDKELMAVDNNPASPYYGRLYIAWTDFTDGRIYAINSANGGTTWSAPIAISALADVQGAWPAVAPNGNVYVAWVRWNPYPSGPINVEVVKSTDGGATYAPVVNPLTGGINPQAAGPTGTCGRPALNGNIRYLPSPQIAVGPDNALHVVYVRDPDAAGSGDVINVYYKRSTDSGATWGAEVQLNDVGTNDQFFPSVSVGATNTVAAAWYDRRDDVGNLRIRYYRRMSFDGGATWGANVQVTDADSPVVIDAGLATCYHGDYDQQVQSPAAAVIVWADDRATEGGGNNADVWTDSVALSTDFLVLPSPAAQEVCAPADAVVNVSVPGFSGFALPVTLAASGNPAGTTTGFAPNPVSPGGNSVLTIGNTGSAAAGTSTVTITGTAAGPIVHTGAVSVTIASGNPAAPALTTPANGALNVPATPVFTWSAAAGASVYAIQVATDAGFSNVVASAVGLASPTWTSTVALNTSTAHYWRVRASNACGTGLYSSVFAFTTVAAPGDCAPGTAAAIAYQYGFEAGAGGWASSGTGNTWAIAATNPHSGTSQYHATDPATVSDQRLVSPAVVLPTGENPVVLRFWHVPNLEASGTTACFDGGILEVSTDGGTIWTQVANANLLIGPYRGAVSASFGNPLAGLQAWCGVTTYMQTVADISAYAGQSAQFRMRLGSDNSVSAPGWDVDDVVVQSCRAFTLVFGDGFESGNTLLWSATLP